MMFLVDQPVCDRPIGVDATVAQEGPVAANVFQCFQIHIADENLLAVVRGFGEHSAEGIAEERSAPELESLAGGRLAANVAGFEADSVHDRDVDSVGNRVRALDGAPGIVLSDAKLGLLRRMPSDGRRVKENRRAL